VIATGGTVNILALDLATKTGGAMWDGNRIVSERLGYGMICRMKPKSKPSKGESVASFEELLKLDPKQVKSIRVLYQPKWRAGQSNPRQERKSSRTPAGEWVN
jgi:hypothetical protein